MHKHRQGLLNSPRSDSNGWRPNPENPPSTSHPSLAILEGPAVALRYLRSGLASMLKGSLSTAIPEKSTEPPGGVLKFVSYIKRS